MALLSIGHTDLYTESHGKGDVVLLVAGLGGSGTFWANQIEPLSQHFRVVLHDQRSVGRSGPGALITGVKDLATDLVALMDALDIDSAHLVGHSTGGVIGQHIALSAPQRLKSLVLSASWGGPTPLFLDTFRTRRDTLINSGVEHYLMMGTLLATPAQWLHDRFEGRTAYLASRIENFPELDVELSRLDAVMAHNLRKQLGRVTTKTTIICAPDDQLTPPGMSEELAALIPDATLKLLDRGGHFCPITNSEHYTALLLQTLLDIQRGTSPNNVAH